jgi:hypothetical protein
MGSGEPLKWKKYQLLVEYDLLTEEELERDIRRYNVEEADRLLDDLGSELTNSQEEEGSLYVVKLVPRMQQGQLPNLRVTKKSDLEDFSRFHRAHQGIKPVEIWYCRTRIGAEIFSVAGRISFSPECFPRSQILEQVWRCSPRLIESFGRGFRYPYARISRCSWGWHYNIEDLYSPPNVLEAQQKGELLFSALLIERRREAIECFLSELEKRGEKSVSLEYKIVGHALSIIDWDTKADREVLQR